MRSLSPRYSSPVNHGHSKVLVLPGLSGGNGFNMTCTVLYGGKTACFAPSGAAALALIEWFGIDTIVAVTPAGAVARRFPCQVIQIQYVVAEVGATRRRLPQQGNSAADQAQPVPQHRRPVLIDRGRRGRSRRYDAIADTPGAVGFVLPEVELEIVDSEGRPVPVGTDGIVRLRTHEFVASREAMEPPRAAPLTALGSIPATSDG